MAKDFSNVNKGSAYSTRRAAAIAAPPEEAKPQPISTDAEQDTPMPETYSRRLQSLVRPSTYAALQKKARHKGLTVNQALNQALEEYVKAE